MKTLVDEEGSQIADEIWLVTCDYELARPAVRAGRAAIPANNTGAEPAAG